MFEGDPDEPEPAKPEPADRVSFGVGRDGRWRIRGNLDITQGRRIEAALTERKDALYHDRRDDNDRDDSAHRDDERATWADALVDCCERSLDAVESSSRRIIEKRDRGCRVPGCTAERYVEIHHIIHWLDGGPTDAWNLLSLCRWHHKLHHQGKLDISGNADDFDGVTFTDAEGRPITARSEPVTQTGALPTTEVPYQHPLAGRFNWNWIGLGWIHPNAIHKRQQLLAEHRVRIEAETKAA